MIELEECIKINLNQNKVVLIDKHDYERVSELKWFAQKDHGSNRWYVISTSKPNIKLHRYLLNPKRTEVVDHINGDGLDNRRINLRIVSNSQNHMNMNKSKLPQSSIYKGVSWHIRHKRWIARIYHEGKRIHLGYFKSESDAANAYNKAASLYFGEYALLNKITKGV